MAHGRIPAIHLKRGTDTILGGTLVADHAGEMIGELAVAIRSGIGLNALGSTIHAYRRSRSLPQAADAAARATDATGAACSARSGCSRERQASPSGSS
jgi:hypothetical protein